MRFIEVDHIPDSTRSEYKAPRKELEAFMKMNIKYALVEFTEGEYVCSCSMFKSIKYPIKRYGLPIKYRAIDGKVYLERTDL